MKKIIPMRNDSNLDSIYATSCKQQEEEIERLKSENALLREVIAYIPANIFWKDLEGNYLGSSMANNITYGLKPEIPLIGKNDQDLLPSDISEKLRLNDKEVMTSGLTQQYEEEVRVNPNDPVSYYLSTKAALKNQQGQIIGLVGAALNITDRKKMELDLQIAKEKAEIANQAKSRFLAIVTHELRTPLTCITGLLQFLKREIVSTYEKEKIIHAIENSADHTSHLIDDILSFSQLETGEFKANIVPTNFKLSLIEVSNMLDILAKKKNLVFKINIDPDLPDFLLTDKKIFRQILINLISNAIKFTEQGSITIDLRQIKQDDLISWVELSVSDTGIGIAHDKFEFIFEPFQQIENAYIRESSRRGTGLGLSIVKKFAALLNMTITLTSDLGQGSCFKLVGQFKLISADSLLSDASLNNQDNINYCASYPITLNYTPRILLVEDDPIVQYIHRKMLAQLGYSIDTVSRGSEVMTIFNQHDLVFMDISLPDINGFEIIKMLREKYPLDQLPIIALTVFTDAENQTNCLNAGANEFASKPISEMELKKLLGRYLRWYKN